MSQEKRDLLPEALMVVGGQKRLGIGSSERGGEIVNTELGVCKVLVIVQMAWDGS